MRKIRIIGLGNVLMSDDALGPTVILSLEAKYNFPENVELLELGTPGFDLLPFVAECDKLVVVDTVRSDEAPGTVKTWARDEISTVPKDRVSPHEPTLFDALRRCDLTGDGPDDFMLVGVVPDSCASGTEMNQIVAKSIPAVIDLILEELGNTGCVVEEKEKHQPANLWWSDS
ncbi:MAG: hydrogenase maturation protease [bacterium]|nr:hydrogenase maturation protease [bacterium]MCP4800765.1 hydrogenase maturation protease [bacterium]